MQKGRFEEAEAVLKKLHAIKGEVHNDLAIREYYQIKKQIEADRAVKATISRFEVFKTPANRKRALIVGLMMWFNMFTG